MTAYQDAGSQYPLGEILSVEEECYPTQIKCPHCRAEQWRYYSAYELYRSEDPVIEKCDVCRQDFRIEEGF